MEIHLLLHVMRGIAIITLALLKHSLFVVVRTVFKMIQHTAWHINGTCDLLQEAWQPQNYNRSAQVLDIVWKNYFDISMPRTMDNFICHHEKFVSPDYVLAEHLTLFFMLDDVAVFAECDEGVETWKSEYDPFHFYATWNHVRKLVAMPIHSYEKLAQKVGPPKGNLCFITNTARCGSTLLTQAFEKTGEAVAISEPEVLNYLAQLQQQNTDQNKLETLTKSVVSLLCKHTNTRKSSSLYAMKLTTTSMSFLPTLYDLYPNAHYVFMYRDVAKVARSLYQCTNKSPLFLSCRYAGCFSLQVYDLLMRKMSFPSFESVRLETSLDLGTLMWCAAMSMYKKQRRTRPDLCCIRYEDLMENPLQLMKKVMSTMNLPERLAAGINEAMKGHSQGNSWLKNSNKVNAPRLTINREKRMNEILAMYDLPQLGEDNCLPGLITLS